VGGVKKGHVVAWIDSSTEKGIGSERKLEGTTKALEELSIGAEQRYGRQ
jgi:hypothetical protein